MKNHSMPFRTIWPHAILFPEFPDGWVLKSSGDEWTMTVRPMISFTENLSVINAIKANP